MTNPKTQKITTEIEVIFRDLDAMGHVNNAVYFTYMETGRTRFFMQLLELAEPLQLPVIVAEANCAYKSPAQFGDVIQIDMSVTRIGRKSFDLLYEMSSKDSRTIAIGRTVMVAYDYDRRCTIIIPYELRSVLETHIIQ